MNKLPMKYDEMTTAKRREVRLQYVEEQNGLCSHCNEPLKTRPKQKIKLNMDLFPTGFLRYPVHLHHCHDTGMTIGAVHSYCNAVLWQYHGE